MRLLVVSMPFHPLYKIDFGPTVESSALYCQHFHAARVYVSGPWQIILVNNCLCLFSSW